jgi:hypothetical protein
LRRFTKRILCAFNRDTLFSLGMSGLVLSVIGVVFFIHDFWHGSPTIVDITLFFTGVFILIVSALFDAVYDKAHLEGDSEDFAV